MELTNEQRKYLGLELIDPAWEKVEISNSINPEHESGRVLLLRLWTDSARCDAAQKSGAKVWHILMERPLVVSVYHIITENPAVDIGEL